MLGLARRQVQCQAWPGDKCNVRPGRETSVMLGLARRQVQCQAWPGDKCNVRPGQETSAMQDLDWPLLSLLAAEELVGLVYLAQQQSTWHTCLCPPLPGGLYLAQVLVDLEVGIIDLSERNSSLMIYLGSVPLHDLWGIPPHPPAFLEGHLQHPQQHHQQYHCCLYHCTISLFKLADSSLCRCNFLNFKPP